MKKLFGLLFITLFVKSAFALETYQCSEKIDRHSSNKSSQYFLKIKEIKDITEAVRKNKNQDEYIDYAYLVKVTLQQVNFKTGRVKTIKKFNTVVESADVHYNLDSKSNGVSTTIYLDELNETTVRLTHANGRTQQIRMDCSL